MPNIASVMREEITRLSRRASRKDLDAVKKISAQHRRHIAALKREMAQLTRQLSALSRKVPAAPAVPSNGSGGTRLRFVAKGLRSHRERLGVSAGEFAKLMGVSAQTIYNWEQGTTRPREQQLGALAGLRNLGKRDVRARLEQLDGHKQAKRTTAARASPPPKRSKRGAHGGAKK